MPSPEEARLWAQLGVDSRIEYVRWVILSALITNARDGWERTGSVSGLTTGDLVKKLLVEDGAFTGSLRDTMRIVRSEKSQHRQETRAALATLLLDDMVRNPVGGFTDVWHLSEKSRTRIASTGHSSEWRLTPLERGRRMLGMKSSV